MAGYTAEACSKCGNYCSKELLTKKRVQFVTVTNNRVYRQRVVDWLCETCVKKDPDFNRPEYSGPNNVSAAAERVKAARIQARKT